jgi:ethanolamine ammonia-lyase small subunit
MADNIDIQFGALVPDLHEQLKAQGFKLSAERIIQLQKTADAITRLSVNFILSPFMVRHARIRLMNQIVKELR